MTATPTEQLDPRAMVAPGQEAVLDEFFAELDQQNAAIQAAEQDAPAPEPALLAGKFKSAEELERGYKELERKLGAKAEAPEPAEAAPEPLTREQASERYGEFIASAAEEEGLDLSAWDAAVRKGEDTADLREKLAARTNIPVQLIEQYEAAFRPQAQPADTGAAQQGFSDADVSELKTLVGGEQEFARLSQWAATNMGADELADYNAAVDSGNKAAVRLALRAMQARATTVQQQGEPELIGGGRPAQVDVFATQQEALAAYRKTDSKGKRLYDSDQKYRAWYEKTLARSNYPA
jgi:hypothetical protein